MPPPKFKNMIEARRWANVRDAWLAHVPNFPATASPPDPGVERLVPLQQAALPASKGRVADIEGVRSNLLWEGVFLFQKCAHSHLAAQRLGTIGMHSWSMFNAYHSAYLGARGVMALLGIGLPNLPQGGQFLIDVFPAPESKKDLKAHAAGNRRFEELLVVRLGRKVEQSDLWDAFQRVLRVTEGPVCDPMVLEELLSVKHEAITGPRNAFLYRPGFWPGDDLLTDRDEDQLRMLLGHTLDTDAQGFLLRLSCAVYRLFEQLISDLAEQSGPIKHQIDESRIISDPGAEDLIAYKTFLSQVSPAIAPG